MKEKIFVSTTFVKDGTPISEVLEICEKAKINNLELGSNHCWQINQRKTVCNFKSNNYLVHNYFPVPKNNFVVNIASNNNNIRKRSNLHAKNCNCSIITMPPAIIQKILKFGKTYQELTLDTVKKFLIDIRNSNFKK